MTHTNHREGTYEIQKSDYIVLIMPSKGFNDTPDIVEKMRKLWDILIKYNPVNGSAIDTGILIEKDAEEIRNNITRKSSMLLAVYTDKDIIEKVVKEVKAANMGISVVVTGLIEDIGEIAERYNIDLHSIEYSLGIHGKTELLAPAYIRQITTMCGHGMISENLVKHLLVKVSNNKLTVEQAVEELGKQCVCGIFNTEKASILFENALTENENTIR